MAKPEKMKSAATAESNYEMLLAEESLILDVQMAVQRLLNDKNVSQADLARRMGVSESYVSQMLGDSARNLTLRTVARVMAALGEKPHLTIKQGKENADECARPYKCEADFGPWGEIVILDDATDGMNIGWSARDWAANENNVALPDWAEAA